jgi:hypothetical protein
LKRHPKPIRVKEAPPGRSKVRDKIKESDRSMKAVEGKPAKSSGDVNLQGHSRSVASLSDSTCVKSSAPSGSNSKRPSVSDSLPCVLNDTSAPGELELRKMARTFFDSVINLLRRTLLSSGDAESMREGVFLELLRCYGFVQAKCLAEGLHLPHDRSAQMLSALFFGLEAKYISFLNDGVKRAMQPSPQSPKADPSPEPPLPE